MMQYLTAFGGGLLSFFSPCILPLLPVYLSLLSGYSAGEILKGVDEGHTRRIAARAAVFIAGFTLAFALLGAAASGLGALMYEHKTALQRFFGVVLVLFGLHMTGAFSVALLNYEKRFPMKKLAGGPGGAFLMGFAFALGWSPCIGPILGTILGLAAASGTAAKGVGLLLAYSAGLAVPLMASALLTARFFAFTAKYKGTMQKIETGAGVVLIAFGLLLFADKLMFVG